MSHFRHLAVSVVAVWSAVVGGSVPAASAAEAALTTSPQLPQTAAAVRAAQWLASQLTPQGYIPLQPGPGADLSSTAQSVLALSATNVDPTGARTAMGYLEAHVDQYVTVDGADGPGKLAILILDAEALGANPQSFGGTNLVTRLLATQEGSGPDVGMFGTEAQAENFAAGNYQQGLALAALTAAGVPIDDQIGAVAWLLDEQCPDGGWTTPDKTNNPCTGTPADFEKPGPDTNATALAVEALEVQNAVTFPPTVFASALTFLTGAEDADGGWSYFPNTIAVPGSTDPDSTALVIQALLALGQSPASAPFTKGSATPISALLSYQLTSGSGAGAFFFPPAPAPANLIATYQAIPALAGLTIPFEPPGPFGPPGHRYWLVASDGGIFSYGDAGFFGSHGGSPLNAPIVGMAATPDGRGYWLVASDGGIFSYGDAGFFGSHGGSPLNAPIVGMAATPDGRGYWLVASDGGIFSYGDAGFFGSHGGSPLNAPIVGMAATPDGRGYWLVASDGGIFSYGDAGFFGSHGGSPLNAPIVGMAATPDGRGYWLVASDGGIFSYGDAGFFGSHGGSPLNAPIVGMAATPDGRGYWLVASDGGIFSYGDAGFFGSHGGSPLNKPIVGIASTSGGLA